MDIKNKVGIVLYQLEEITQYDCGLEECEQCSILSPEICDAIVNCKLQLEREGIKPKKVELVEIGKNKNL